MQIVKSYNKQEDLLFINITTHKHISSITQTSYYRQGYQLSYGCNKFSPHVYVEICNMTSHVRD